MSSKLYNLPFTIEGTKSDITYTPKDFKKKSIKKDDFKGAYIIFDLTTGQNYVGSSRKVKKALFKIFKGKNSSMAEVYYGWKAGHEITIQAVDIKDTDYRFVRNLRKGLRRIVAKYEKALAKEIKKLNISDDND